MMILKLILIESVQMIHIWIDYLSRRIVSLIELKIAGDLQSVQLIALSYTTAHGLIWIE